MQSNTLRVFAVWFLVFTGFIAAQTVPRSSHVWIVTEENHSYESIVGNSSMPYYNQLIQKYGLATQFYANQHSSLPALMWFVAGSRNAPLSKTSLHVLMYSISRTLVARSRPSVRSYHAFQRSDFSRS